MFLHLFAAGLLLFTSVAAFIGIFKAHILPDGLVFGTSTGSLALLAFAVSITLWMKQLKACGEKCDVCVDQPAPKKKK